VRKNRTGYRMVRVTSVAGFRAARHRGRPPLDVVVKVLDGLLTWLSQATKEVEADSELRDNTGLPRFLFAAGPAGIKRCIPRNCCLTCKSSMRSVALSSRRPNRSGCRQLAYERRKWVPPPSRWVTWGGVGGPPLFSPDFGTFCVQELPSKN
jgi:hypothetical protein